MDKRGSLVFWVWYDWMFMCILTHSHVYSDELISSYIKGHVSHVAIRLFLVKCVYTTTVRLILINDIYKIITALAESTLPR